MKTVYVIINPISGASPKTNIPQRILKSYDPTKFEVHFIYTGYAGHGFELAQKAVEQNVDYVIAVGGDGTVNEIAKALVGSNTALGIIPKGSGNGLARDLRIPMNTTDSIKVLREENVISIDYGIANNHIFFCTCGVGFDALVSKRVANEKRRGSLMYIKNVVETFFTEIPENYEIIYPGGVIKEKAFVVTCANAGQYGNNAFIAPKANIQDGKMNLALLRPINILEAPQTTLQLFSKKIEENKKLVEILCSEATIKREKEGIMHIDGDAVQTEKDIHVKIIPQGLKVIVPNDDFKCKPDPTDIVTEMLRWWV